MKASFLIQCFVSVSRKLFSHSLAPEPDLRVKNGRFAPDTGHSPEGARMVSTTGDAVHFLQLVSMGKDVSVAHSLIELS